MIDSLLKPKALIPLILLLTVVFIQIFRDVDFADPQELKQFVADGALLIDVRSPQEYATQHLQEAINIPINDLENHLQMLGKKDQKIIVYCRSGRRSTRAHSLLLTHGFKEVYNLGGMNRWSQ